VYLVDEIKIRKMGIGDYDSVIYLWKNTEGIGLSEADTKDNILQFLLRNPRLSFVADKDNEIIGAVLCGNDGRRGYVHHLAVKKEYQFKGLGKAMIQNCLKKLSSIGIGKCHLFVFRENEDGIKFWDHTGWHTRVDLRVMSKLTPGQS